MHVDRREYLGSIERISVIMIFLWCTDGEELVISLHVWTAQLVTDRSPCSHLVLIVGVETTCVEDDGQISTEISRSITVP